MPLTCSTLPSPSPPPPKSGALALLVHEGEKPSGLWEQLDEATAGAISRAFEVAEFKGAKGKTCMILAPGGTLSRVLAVGLGKPAEVTQKTLEEAGGAIVAHLSRETSVSRRQQQPGCATGGGGCPGRHAAQLPVRPLPHKGKSRGQAQAGEADPSGARGWQGQNGVGAAGGNRQGRVLEPRPGE